MDYWDLGLRFPLPLGRGLSLGLPVFEETNQDVKLISGLRKALRLPIDSLIRGSSE